MIFNPLDLSDPMASDRADQLLDPDWIVGPYLEVERQLLASRYEACPVAAVARVVFLNYFDL